MTTLTILRNLLIFGVIALMLLVYGRRMIIRAVIFLLTIAISLLNIYIGEDETGDYEA